MSEPSPTPRMNPPFRAEHVGSLLRPAELLAARRAREAGEVGEEDLHQAEEAAIVGAIRLQEEVGLESITDGEFRRHMYFGHFAQAVDGFTEMEAEIRFTDESGEPMRYRTDVIVDRLRRARGITTHEFAFVRAHTSRTPKVTLPDPASQHSFRYRKGVSDKVYPDLDELFSDVARIYQEELAELAGLGATYVQLDSVAFPLLCDAHHRSGVEADGHDPDDLVERYVELTNAALADRPSSLVVGMHLCRGNNQGKWLGEGAYDLIAEQVFGRLTLDVLFLEYDTGRAGGFEPLRHLSTDKIAVLGLVSTKTPVLETKDDLLRRIDEASRFVPLERLAISPQCGFASVEQGNPITRDDQRRKLELVVDVAQAVWSGRS